TLPLNCVASECRAIRLLPLIMRFSAGVPSECRLISPTACLPSAVWRENFENAFASKSRSISSKASV
ncbi:TPA: hypothetical protein ACFOC4_001832, partial [Neisseria meningitidis]